VRAGSHDVAPSKKVDISAFSYSKSIKKSSPEEFIRKNTGTGGTKVTIIIIEAFRTELSSI
jgi:hypothetical protein